MNTARGTGNSDLESDPAGAERPGEIPRPDSQRNAHLQGKRRRRGGQRRPHGDPSGHGTWRWFVYYAVQERRLADAAKDGCLPQSFRSRVREAADFSRMIVHHPRFHAIVDRRNRV